MSYLVDTDWAVDYLKNRPQAVSLLAELAPKGLSISIITYGEIFEGIVDNPDQERHEQGLADFLNWAAVLPLSPSSMRLFARLRSTLRHQGQLIADFDLLIAASAMDNGLTLVTRNRRHFERIPDLIIH